MFHSLVRGIKTAFDLSSPLFSSIYPPRNLVDASLALHILDKLDIELSVLCTHLRSERPGGLPLARRARRRLLEHLVDLLERQTLGLGHEEVRVHKGAGAETAPHKEHG